jgi:hypothetical protein
VSEWTPERLRALDRAVAEARGWRPWGREPGEHGHLYEVWLDPDGCKRALPPVSLGTRETFELMEEERIGVGYMLRNEEWWADTPAIGFYTQAPTPAVAVCLAYLASKGRRFEG